MSDPTLREALIDMIEHDADQRDCCGDWGTNTCPHRLRAEKVLRESFALATTPAPLDVERLARAIESAVAGNQSDMETKDCDELAERFAREYAKPDRSTP